MHVIARQENIKALEIHKNCSSLSAPGKYPDYEGTPRYSIVKHDSATSDASAISIRVVVSPKDFNSGSMTRLACQLASDFPKVSRVDALIFDNRSAAQSLAVGMTDQRDYGTYLWHLRGHYVLDREKSEQYIELVIPDLQDNLLTLKRVKVTLATSKSQ
jgi:hypothetical protein